MKKVKSNYPRFLPCGTIINSEKDCCKTICSNLTNDEIEECYSKHKKEIIKKLKPIFGDSLQDENWYVFLDIYFCDRSG
jgi:hypothetical protein